MANKVLKTSVRLETKQAERSLVALEKKIRNVQRAINNQASVTNKLNKATSNLARTNNKLVNSASKATSAHHKEGKAIDMLTTKVYRLANAYLGVMGAKAMVTASDTITHAQNRLNNLEGGNPAATESAMNKMYTAAQGGRTSYSGMMSNVAKSMTLAGEAFGNNIDNAIRFQEIMAKSYTLGGASQAEQHSSMYQMIQGLGSGILQGDELRSVREGAPLAYKAIEEFAQGIYGADQNLKDLASQGKITSDIVVAAIMSAGDEMDRKFKDTAMTFDQAWTMIKNTALQSFKPLLEMLNQALNRLAADGVFEKIGTAIQIVAGALQIVFSFVAKIYNFVANNWELISDVMMTIATIIAIALIPKFISWLAYLGFVIRYYAYVGAVALTAGIRAMAGWMMANIPLVILLAILAAVVIAIIWVADSFVDACGNIAGSVWVVVSFIKTLFSALVNFFIAVGTNIGIALSNPMEAAKAAFWGWVGDCLEGISWLEPAFNAIAKLFGGEGFTLSGLIGDVRSREQASLNQLNYVDTGAAFTDTMSAWSAGAAFDQGYNWGVDKVNGAKDWISDKLNLGLPNVGLETTPIDDIASGVGDIGENTGSIADSMELTQEDLEYLRKIADMEWKKEFTTATIQVDMSNYNTVNGESDLDGIVTKLTDKLYEELNVVANGVYV